MATAYAPPHAALIRLHRAFPHTSKFPRDVFDCFADRNVPERVGYDKIVHELSIALSILDVAEEEMERRGNVPVEAIYLKVGPLSGVVKEALLSAYELAREQTPFASSRLVIEDVPIIIFCRSCGAERPARSAQELRCAHCDAPADQIIHGRELQLAALELAE